MLQEDTEYVDRFISWCEGDIILDAGICGDSPEVYVNELDVDISHQHNEVLSWICRHVGR
jgi:hypothetical protein